MERRGEERDKVMVLTNKETHVTHVGLMYGGH